MTLNNERLVRFTFDLIDEDKSGFIDPDEFHALCKRISPQMTEEEIADALEVIDEDGDGTRDEPVCVVGSAPVGASADFGRGAQV